MEHRLSFLVDRHLSGSRIDRFLTFQLRNYSSARIARLIDWGLVSIDHVPCEIRTRVFFHQQIDVVLAIPPDDIYDAEAYPVTVVAEDPWLLAINKPPGVIVHPTGDYRTMTLCNQSQWHLDQQTPLTGMLKGGIVHRLDRLTSGVILLAKDHEAHRGLTHAFERRRVTKSYLALVEGHLEAAKGTITLPIGLWPDGRSKMMCTRGDARDPKTAKTSYEVIAHYNKVTLVKVHPLTGRNHQIRVHFAAIGHPLVGEEVYDTHHRLLPWPREEQTPVSPLIDRQALHAYELELMHPITHHRVCFRAAPPADFVAAVLRAEKGTTEDVCGSTQSNT